MARSTAYVLLSETYLALTVPKVRGEARENTFSDGYYHVTVLVNQMLHVARRAKALGSQYEALRAEMRRAKPYDIPSFALRLVRSGPVGYTAPYCCQYRRVARIRRGA